VTRRAPLAEEKSTKAISHNAGKDAGRAPLVEERSTKTLSHNVGKYAGGAPLAGETSARTIFHNVGSHAEVVSILSTSWRLIKTINDVLNRIEQTREDARALRVSLRIV
jgi:hypothetical protein